MFITFILANSKTRLDRQHPASTSGLHAGFFGRLRLPQNDGKANLTGQIKACSFGLPYPTYNTNR